MSDLYLYVNQTFVLTERSTEVRHQFKFRDAQLLICISGCPGRITKQAINYHCPQIILIVLITRTW
jgi:hypothetical protein